MHFVSPEFIECHQHLDCINITSRKISSCFVISASRDVTVSINTFDAAIRSAKLTLLSFEPSHADIPQVNIFS